MNYFVKESFRLTLTLYMFLRNGRPQSNPFIVVTRCKFDLMHTNGNGHKFGSGAQKISSQFLNY
jgi:hypothetical protein